VKPLTERNLNDKAAMRLGRRRLLQVMAATGGAAVAVALLPGEWVKPVVEVGHLPAHAQGSGPFVSNGVQTATGQLCTNTGTGQQGNQYEVSFSYSNTLGDVKPGSVVHHAFEFRPVAIAGSFDVPLTATHITGDGYSGVIRYNVCIAFASATELVNTISLTDVAGRTGAPYTFTMAKPLGALDVGPASIDCVSN
jgi:hypothetical protein